MVKRGIILAVLLSLVCCAAPGCAATSSTSPSDSPAQSGEVITWKVQNMMPTGTGPYDSLERVTAEINEASGGRLVWKPFPGGGVVPAGEEFDGVDSNAIQAATITFPQLLNLFPAASLFAGRVGGMEPVQMLSWITQGGGQCAEGLRIRGAARNLVPLHCAHQQSQ